MSLPEPRILRYARWLAQHRSLDFDVSTRSGYEALWQWSISDLSGFWRSIWDYNAIESPAPPGAVLAEPVMPGAKWFPGTEVNYARHLLRHADAAHAAGHPALLFQDERGAAAGETPRAIGWPELRRQVGALAHALQAMGVAPGDRVGAFLPNRPETIVAFLACASIGAVWSVCSPDMGPVAVLDRFRQIEPKVLFAVEGYVYGGIEHDRRAVLAQLLDELPSVRDVVVAGRAPTLPCDRRLHAFADLAAGDAAFEPRWLPFDHPLWIVYSSGTTGLPKAIVHGHGGIMLEALKSGLHNNLGPTVETGDRYHWYSSTGWIMWNSQVGALLGGTTVCIYDGSPSGKAGQPDWGTLWRFAASAGATFFGAGAAFYASCLKADVQPQREADLSALRAIGSTGSPLADECYDWIWQRLPRPGGERIWLDPISGGTDFAGAFLAGLVTLPVVRGEMQCRCLGAAVYAYSEADANGVGRPLVDEVGELVCTEPMPSMPLRFWNDPGDRRYLDSYFDMYRHPDGRRIWRHGDWLRITRTGGGIIYGRSDATINRHGIRMGTAELYRAVEALPEVVDSLVVDLEYLGRESWMPLFVVLREGLALDDALAARIKAAIRSALSARHVPNDIFQVAAVPRTLSGKKMELPVKKLLLGEPPAKVMNRDAMANAGCVDWYVEFAARRAAATAAAR
ncbi:MAG: acetoacetate--CoA ligase [Betaproteobacteria bacterium]